MRVVIDARESGTSTGRYIDKLVEHLHGIKSDFELIILTKPSRVDFFNSIAPGFNVVESEHREFSFGEQYGLVWQLYGLRAGLVHFGMTQQPILYFGDCVTTIHDLTTVRFRNPAKNIAAFSLKQAVYKWLVKRVARKSKIVIVSSEFVKDDVATFAKIPKNKIHVIYEAADKIAEAPVPIDSLAQKRFLLYVGRPLPHKNLKRLVAAFGRLKAEHPDLVLALAGKWDKNFRFLQSFVIKNDINDVVFLDFVSEGQLRWLYENTAAYVFPSLSEGFGLPGLEAMAHGAPVVSSNATCLPEIYGQAAHYFDPQDTNDIADKIDDVLNNEKLAGGLIKRGYQQAAKYSWQTTARQTLEIYQKLTNK